MPIYEYQCAACGHRLEKLQKVSDPRLTVCPACNEEALSKLISPAAFRLKGSGWYETDFKTGKKRNLIGGATGGDPAPVDSSGGGETGAGKDSSSADSSPAQSSSKAPADGAKSGDN